MGLSEDLLLVDVKPGQRVVAECGLSVTGGSFFLLILYTTVKAHDYLWLRQISE
jgi:hypothetical protein